MPQIKKGLGRSRKLAQKYALIYNPNNVKYSYLHPTQAHKSFKIRRSIHTKHEILLSSPNK